jgi:hypothetical protein
MRVVIYELFNNFSEKLIAPVMRRTGKRLYEIGNNLEGEILSEDRITPSLRKLVYDGKEPEL